MVIDPFAGTGSTGVSALSHGNFSITIDFEGDVQVRSRSLVDLCLITLIQYIVCLQTQMDNWQGRVVDANEQGKILKVSLHTCHICCGLIVM